MEAVRHNRPACDRHCQAHPEGPAADVTTTIGARGRSEEVAQAESSGDVMKDAPVFGRRVPLPPEVAAIYRAAAELEARYPGRRFTPDGHLVGSIGEVVAAEALGLTLYPSSHPCHDAHDANGDVQIKMTARDSVSMYSSCDRLVVLRRIDDKEAEIVYDGPGAAVWESAGKKSKNGQRSISLSKLRRLDLGL